MKQLERLDKLYGEFYVDYWGSKYELTKKRNRAYPEVVRELMKELDYEEEQAWRFAANYIDDWLKTGTLPIEAYLHNIGEDLRNKRMEEMGNW